MRVRLNEKKVPKLPIQPGGKPISFSKGASGRKKLEILPTSVLKRQANIFVYKKKRPISRQEANEPPWNLEDAQKAIFLEKMFIERQQKSASLVIKFPDDKINDALIRGYSPNIDAVTFIQSAAPRYCYVTLKPGSNVNDEIANISKIPFQNGYLSARLRHPMAFGPPPVPREIDSTTLYVGNLLPDISVNEVKEHFSNYVRIDIGYSLKKKWRRYALIRYKNAEDAMHAFAVAFGSSIRDTSIIVRFHRIKNWKILEEVEAQTEIPSFKIKKEKEDAGYDEALRKANSNYANCGGTAQRSNYDSNVTQMAPASFPIARPLVDISIVKREPVSPQHVVNKETPITNFNEKSEQCNNAGSNWNNCMQYFQYMMYLQQLNSQQQPQQHQQQPLLQNFQATNQQMFPFQPQFPQQQQQQQLNTNYEFAPFMQNIPPPPPPAPLKQFGPNNCQERPENPPPLMDLNLTAVNMAQPGRVDILKMPRIPKKNNSQNTANMQESTGLDSYQPAAVEEMSSQRYVPASRRPPANAGPHNFSTPQRARNSRRPYGTQQNSGPVYSQQRRDHNQGRTGSRGNKYGGNSMDTAGRKRRR